MERSSQGEASAAVRWDGPTVRDFTGELPVLVNVAHPMARKWVITPIINGISRVNPLITGVITVITHLLSGMSHQVVNVYMTNWKITVLSING